MTGVSRPVTGASAARGASGATIWSRPCAAISDCSTTTYGYARRAAGIGFRWTSNCAIVALVVRAHEFRERAMLFGVGVGGMQILLQLRAQRGRALLGIRLRE